MKRFVCLVAVASVVAVLLGTAHADADNPETGVWWRLRPDNSTPRPPVLVDIPDQGLWLDSGPNGNQAQSAVRFRVSARVVPEALTLRVHEDASVPALRVSLCLAANAWVKPESSPGGWNSRAEPNCERYRANGIVQATGDAVVFSLTGAPTAAGVLDLVLTRAPDDQTSYQNVTFARPTIGDLELGSPVGLGVGLPAADTSFGGGASPPPSSGGAAYSAAPSPFAFGADAGGPLRTATSRAADEAPGLALESAASNAAASRSALRRRVIEPATEAGAVRVAFLLVLGVLLTWMAAIASKRLATEQSATAATFTLYRGTRDRRRR